MAATETVFVADGLLLMKVFRRNHKDAASTLSAVDVFGGILGGLIFVVLTTFWLNSIGWKTVLVMEAASRIVGASLLRILEENLSQYFADGPASEAFFGAQGLTKSLLYAKLNA
jgi:hypothetical protein